MNKEISDQLGRVSKLYKCMKEHDLTLDDLFEVIAHKIEPDTEIVSLRSDGVILLKHMRDMAANMIFSGHAPNARFSGTGRTYAEK